MEVAVTDPAELFAQHVAEETGFDRTDLDTEDVPPTAAAHHVRLAKRCLQHGVSQLGHHESVRTSMEAWVDEVGGDDRDPGYYRRCVFSLTPRERNVGRLEGDQEAVCQKAATVTAWAAATFGERSVQRSQAALEREYVETWDDAVAEAARRERGKQFLSSPPQHVNGWRRVDAPGFGLAYYGCNEVGRKPHVIALFEFDEYVRLWSICPEVYASTVRHFDSFDVAGIREYRDKRLANPEAWVDGAAQLQRHLDAIAGDQVIRPCLDSLDDTPGQQSLLAFR